MSRADEAACRGKVWRTRPISEGSDLSHEDGIRREGYVFFGARLEVTYEAYVGLQKRERELLA